MIYGSVCSGIEAATVAWHPLGWTPAFFSEIEAFPRAVLKHHYPDVPLHGDFTTIEPDQYRPIDLLVGGTPCQSFSVAGLRGGLSDERGNLALEFLLLARRIRPRWVVWENVPGVFSSLSHAAPDPVPPTPPLDMGCDGAEVDTEDDYASEELHALNCFLAGLSECGYGWAYRVLDAQFTGVPQRRRRVFVVGYLGDWRPPAAVLFEPESLRGDSPPRREAGQRIARPIAGRLEGGSGYRNDADTADNLIVPAIAAPLTHGVESRGRGGHAGRRREDDHNLVAAFGGNNTSGELAVDTAINAHGGPHGRLDFESETFVTHSLRADGFGASEDGTGRATPITVALRGREGGATAELGDDVGCAVRASQGGGDKPHVLSEMSVRRLTPRECERLQGFPDDWTAITYRGKAAADGPRYRALGNSMAVPCMSWIGKRIDLVDAPLSATNS